MDSPTARALALLELLQSHDELGGAELSERLHIDGRTLRRYITKLKDMGIPVESERGRYGAYRLTAGFRLPPLMFSNAEALTVSVALGFASQQMGGLQGTDSALGKLDRVTPKALRTRLRALHKTMQLKQGPGSGPIPGEALLELSAATHSHQRVHMRYAAADQALSERDFDCYGLSWREGFWYAVGYCHLRRDLRSFRVDRIASVATLKARFVPPADFDAVRQLALGMASIARRHQVTVRLKTDMQTARKELFDAIGLFTPAGKEVLLHSQVDDLDWYARQLARLPFGFAVVQPPALRTALHAVARRLLRL